MAPPAPALRVLGSDGSGGGSALLTVAPSR
jgi:hypothetical protein